MVERTKCVSDLPSWFQLNKYQLSKHLNPTEIYND
jgi:hypothetical protein